MLRWEIYSVIVLIFVVVYSYLRKEGSGQFISQTWFGFLLILGGVSFLANATLHDHMIMQHGRFRGAVLDRWQIGFLGLLSLGFGIVWLYGPLRRWLKNRNRK